MKQKNKQNIIWYVVAAVAVLLASPNSTIVKVTMDEVGPLWFNVFRFAVIAVLMTPFIILSIKKMTKKNVRYALLSGAAYATAVVGYTSAIHLSQASYVSTIDLAIPILLMVYSVLLTKEKVTRKSFVGIGIAALGGFIIIALPSLLSGSLESGFSLQATLLAFLNCLSFPLAVIFSRKANEAGLSLWATFGIMALVSTSVNIVIALAVGAPAPIVSDLSQPGVIGAILYSAIAVSLLARLMTVAAYEKIGSATVAGLTYVESFISITLPILLLSERLTSETIIGGMLILIGVLIIELKHAPRLHIHRQHLPRHT